MEETPFGNPEGALANLNDLLTHDFVSFDSRSYGGGISVDPDDLTVRVLVGAKGSGKTAYLRRLHDALSNRDGSIYVDPDIGLEPPPTEEVYRFCSLFEENLLTEKWMALWRCAILRTLLSHMLYSPTLASHVSSYQHAALLDLVKQARLSGRVPEPIYSSARVLLHTCRTSTSFDGMWNSPVWDAIAYHLAESIHDMPPCCFILDSVDEEFKHAPMHWLRAQKGLFYCVMRLLRNQRLGGRLHVVIAVRDHVFSSVLKSEHQNRYRGEPHIRILDWGWNAIQHLLETKVSRLDDRYTMSSDMPTGSTIARWLGAAKVRNGGRDLLEPLEQYLIRHTRQLPRDVVQLGNALSLAVKDAKARGDAAVKNSTIRNVVHRRAKSFGAEQLAICANQILSGNIPTEAGRYEYTDLYTGNDEYRKEMVDDLKELILSIGTDAFTSEAFDEAEARSKKVFGRDSDALSVLWQNRLLGYRGTQVGDEEHLHEIFYSENNLDDFRLPRGMREYFFHPIMIDSVGIRSNAPRPLTPGLHCN